MYNVRLHACSIASLKQSSQSFYLNFFHPQQGDGCFENLRLYRLQFGDELAGRSSSVLPIAWLCSCQCNATSFELGATEAVARSYEYVAGVTCARAYVSTLPASAVAVCTTRMHFTVWLSAHTYTTCTHTVKLHA